MPKRIVPIFAPKFNIQTNEDHTQVYACFGGEAFPYNHANKEALMLLNNILGGPGMNSRLNLAVREKHGLTYQIDSSYTAYDDCGLFYISFSTEEKHLKKTTRLIEKELFKLCDKPLGKLQMQQAKNQFRGQLQLSEESKVSLLIFQGKSLLFYNKIESLNELLDKTNSVTTAQLQDIANEILQPEKLSRLLFVPNV